MWATAVPGFLRKCGGRLQGLRSRPCFDRIPLEEKTGYMTQPAKVGGTGLRGPRSYPGEQERGSDHLLNKSHMQLASEALTWSQQQPAPYAASRLDNHGHWFLSFLI